MKKNIFDYHDYKAYLNAVVLDQPKAGHGFRVKLADAVGCQRAFVSQVLQGEVHFNLEHADRINHFLTHSEEEANFFLLMVQYARAGTDSLRSHFRKQMQKIFSARLLLKNRMAHQTELNLEDKQRYYSSWHYGAVRIAVSIAGLQSKAALQQRLKISPLRIAEVLDFLVSTGLLEQKGDKYLDTTNFTHLGNDSALIAKHHTNWRMRAILALDEEARHDLHFSGIFSISKKDMLRIKEELIAKISEVQKEISPSKEETLVSFCLDWFEL